MLSDRRRDQEIASLVSDLRRQEQEGVSVCASMRRFPTLPYDFLMGTVIHSCKVTALLMSQGPRRFEAESHG